jgi:hypothetical protein
VDTWFEKGVGIIRKDQIHHGTIGELHTRLLRFEPAARGSATPSEPRPSGSVARTFTSRH